MRIRHNSLITLSILVLLAGFYLTGNADAYLEATEGKYPVVAESYFGTHFHRLALNPGEKSSLTHWPASSIGAIRLWDSGTLWSEIAIQPGQWKYERMDTYVEQASAHNAGILYTLGGTPRWASARPDEKCSYGFGCAAESVRIAHWEEYVRRVAQHYRGRIAAYELWNEPNFSDVPRDRGKPGFFTGSVAQMVEMAKIARKVLDEVDPGAKLSTPGFVNGPDRLEMFLAAGGNQYVQAIAYHFYSENSLHMAKQLVEVRGIMQRQGVAALPIWNTETGIEVLGPNNPPSGIAAHSQIEAAQKLAQYLILGAAAGLEHYYQYAWDNEHSGMISQRGDDLPPRESFDKVSSWLTSATMQTCQGLASDGVICMAELNNQKFIFAWSNNKDLMRSISIPRGWHVVSREKLFSGSPEPFLTHGQSIKVLVSAEPVRFVLNPDQF